MNNQLTSLNINLELASTVIVSIAKRNMIDDDVIYKLLAD